MYTYADIPYPFQSAISLFRIRMEYRDESLDRIQSSLLLITIRKRLFWVIIYSISVDMEDSELWIDERKCGMQLPWLYSPPPFFYILLVAVTKSIEIQISCRVAEISTAMARLPEPSFAPVSFLEGILNLQRPSPRSLLPWALDGGDEVLLVLFWLQWLNRDIKYLDLEFIAWFQLRGSV